MESNDESIWGTLTQKFFYSRYLMATTDIMVEYDESLRTKALFEKWWRPEGEWNEMNRSIFYKNHNSYYFRNKQKPPKFSRAIIKDWFKKFRTSENFYWSWSRSKSFGSPRNPKWNEIIISKRANKNVCQKSDRIWLNIRDWQSGKEVILIIENECCHFRKYRFIKSAIWPLLNEDVTKLCLSEPLGAINIFKNLSGWRSEWMYCLLYSEITVGSLFFSRW